MNILHLDSDGYYSQDFVHSVSVNPQYSVLIGICQMKEHVILYVISRFNHPVIDT